MSKTNIANYIHSIVEKRPADSKELFNSIMSEKILYKMAEKRHAMAKTLFHNIKEAEEKDWVLLKPGEKIEDKDGGPFYTKEGAQKALEEAKKKPGNAGCKIQQVKK